MSLRNVLAGAEVLERGRSKAADGQPYQGAVRPPVTARQIGKLLAPGVTDDRWFRRMSDDAARIDERDRADSGEAYACGLEHTKQFRVRRTRASDTSALQRHLAQRRVSSPERLSQVSREDEREILGAVIAGAKDLRPAPPQVSAAKADQGDENERGDKPDGKLAIPHRQQPQMHSMQQKTSAVYDP